MSQSVYSWMGTDIHLVLEDDVADNFNRAQDAFMEAQKNFKTTTGKNWTGTEALWMNWTMDEQRAWNGIAAIINQLADLNHGSIEIMEEDMTTTYLVKL